MREMKCSYCKHDLTYVSKRLTIYDIELMTYRCVYCGVNYKYHKLDEFYSDTHNLNESYPLNMQRPFSKIVVNMCVSSETAGY